MSSKSENNSTENRSQESTANSLRACLVDGDPAQIARNQSRRRRSLLISVLLQITALAALILVPILSKTERITLANTMIPMPPYRHAVVTDHTVRHTHRDPQPHQFTFCLSCPPVLPSVPTPTNNPTGESDPSGGIPIDEGPGVECPSCIDLRTNTNSQPAIPREPIRKIILTHIDPAMLMHRVEPAYPTLAQQTRQEGTVELHAIIATDGSVRSLQILEGNALFYESALDAVRQWRYRPTYLNGNPVEVDTHITVIYKINR